MKILVIGYSGSGKTTAAVLMSRYLNTNIANISDYIISEYAESINLDPKTILANKNAYRMPLWHYGRMKQSTDPLYFVRKAIEDADIITGVRNQDEIQEIKRFKLFDIIMWIDSKHCIANDTDQLKPWDADTIINNDKSILDLEDKLITAIESIEKSESEFFG